MTTALKVCSVATRMVDFENSAARDDYLPHPAHQAVGKMIVGITEGGVDGITVLDWES